MEVFKMLQKELETLPPSIVSRKDGQEIAITVKFANNDYHHILPDNEGVARELIAACAEHLGAASVAVKAEAAPVATAAAPEEVVFKNRQAIGDILCMTAAVRDFKASFPETKVGVITTASHLWDHNPNIEHSFRDEQRILEIGPGFGTNRSNAWNIHLIDAFRIDIERKLNLRIDKGDLKPDIWMTQEEYDRPPIIDSPYWIIITGGEPGWTAKQYNRWQQVVDILKGKVQFVQLGVKNHPWPVLDGAINMIGRTEDRNTGLRDLFNIFLHAQGSLGLVSMQMHLSAAFGNPCVVVAGAREPAWFTHYFGHQYLQTNGTTSCGLHSACWKCKMEGCKSPVDAQHKVNGHMVPRCIDIIEPEEVAEAVLKYYKGGRLEFGVKMPNKFFRNIAKQSRVFSAPKPAASDEEIVKNSGFKWGGGCLTDRDWMFIKKTIVQNDVKTVLEFGAGLSTILFSNTVDKVETYETSAGWAKRITALANPAKSTITLWDGKNFGSFFGVNYDLAFVDGPSGGSTREFSTKVASQLANIVVVHDANRVHERQWQQKYLEPEFKMTSKGGHRCHLWIRKTLLKEEPAPAVAPCGKTAVMITTCRGFGGSERSTIEIMKQLQSKGYRVFLAPTGNISGEYQSNIPKGVGVIEWPVLAEVSTDLAVLYASDTIWNFKNEQYTSVMPKLQTDRKVMVLNYQLGGAGNVEWTKGWDLYMFLNSTKEREFLAIAPGSSTKVLAPATDLDNFFAAAGKVNYGGVLRLIRHSSQNDAKHPDYTNDLINEIWKADRDAEFHFMPPRSDCMEHPQVFKYKKNQPPVWEFLQKGNCFFYHLPPGYQDQGPRTLIECAAAGLAAIADNRYGAKDRITKDTGWLVNDRYEIIEVIREIVANPKILRTKGEAAHRRAREHFTPDRWIDAILGAQCKDEGNLQHTRAQGFGV